jgi:hypothetical protein
LHQGYWLCGVTAAEVNGSQILPLYEKLFSVEAKDFTSEKAEVPAAVDLIGAPTRGRGIWAMDRGGDRKNLLEPLLDRGARFVIRSTGKRTVTDRHGPLGKRDRGGRAVPAPSPGAHRQDPGGSRKRPIRCATAPNPFACRGGWRSSGWW